MAPEGLALFYSRPSIRDDLRLHEYGWHMLADPSAYDSLEWTPAASARRFECGSPNMLGIHALSASLSLIQYVGIHLIENMVLDNTRYFIELCNIHDNLLEIMTETSEHRRSGIVTFRPRRMAAEEAYQRLMARGVICACRGGGVRFSTHFYTSREKIDEAFSILISVVS
jgi:selenocysteine lyase/cysteine desulfurase